MRPRIAVVTVVHGRHDHLRLQQQSLSMGRLVPDRHVVVALEDEALRSWDPPRGLTTARVDLAADPEALPLAAARNAGAALAMNEGAECLIFLDVDCVAGEYLLASYFDAVSRRPGVVWSGPVTYLPPAPSGGYDLGMLPALDSPHPARPDPGRGQELLEADPSLFWSLSFAVHAEGWSRAGGFCEEYVGYGGEDTDFALLARHAGLDLGWVGSARGYHQHHPVENPPVRHLEAILRNARLFHSRWGRWPMEGWLEEFARRGLLVRRDEAWFLPSEPGGR